MSKIICIDAGHGGRDPGAVGNGLQEADLTISIAEGAIQRLEAYACEVYMVPRVEDLAERAVYANSRRADLFLSIHVNAGGGTGFESYTYLTTGAETKKAQSVIHSAIMGYMRKFNMPDRGQKATNFQVLRETAMPAVLLECLFIDRQEDAKLLKSPVFLDGLANEVAYGVVQALGLQKVPVDDPKLDPCAKCQKISDLIIENTNLHDENMRTKQIVKEVKILLNNI